MKLTLFNGEVKVFTLILPKNRSLYQDKLETMFQKRRADALDTQDSIYIVFEDKRRSLFGSCRVNPLRESPLTKADLVSIKNCDDLGLLEVSCVSFDEDEILLGSPNRIFLTKWFFSGLLEVLKTIQVNNTLKGFLSLNLPEEHLRCEDFGDWDFHAPFEFPRQDREGSLYAGFVLCEAALGKSSVQERQCA